MGSSEESPDDEFAMLGTKAFRKLRIPRPSGRTRLDAYVGKWFPALRREWIIF
jgi:hypothetical protein